MSASIVVVVVKKTIATSSTRLGPDSSERTNVAAQVDTHEPTNIDAPALLLYLHSFQRQLESGLIFH